MEGKSDDGSMAGRGFESIEQTHRIGKFIGESCESIDGNRICAVDANGDVSFSSYLLEGVEEETRRSWKGSDLVDEQSQGIKEVTFSISNCRGVDGTFHHVEREFLAVKSRRRKFAEGVKDREDMDMAIGKISPGCALPYARGAPVKDLLIGPNPGNTLQKQVPCGNRVPVVGRQSKDAEISIFDAERYFSVHQEKKAAELDGGGTRIQRRSEKTARDVGKGSSSSRSKAKAKGFFSDIFLDAHPSRTPRISAASSVDGSRGYRSSSFRGTPTASSEASWNSRSGLLPGRASRPSSIQAQSLPSGDAKKATGKWCIGGFGCKCPCSGRNSVEIDQKLTETRPMASVSNSNSRFSSRLSSPVNSTYENPRRAPSQCTDNNVEEKAATSVSKFGSVQSRDLDSNGDCHGNNNNDNNNRIEDAMGGSYHVRIPSAQWKSAGGEDEIPTFVPRAGQYEETHHSQYNNGRIHSRSISFENESDGFSFPILQPPSPVSEKSDEMARSSLEVFGSPFPESSEFNTSRQSAELHRRLALFSLENPRKSFTFPTVDNNSSLQEEIEDAAAEARDRKNNGDAAESDSSSDLFEIESLSTQATANYTLCNNPRRDSMESRNSDDISATETARNSFHFQSINGDAATPSAQSSCYEPSEVSLDWSIATVDTVEKAGSSEYEEARMSKRYDKVSGSKPAEVSLNFRANSTRIRRTGIFGCRCEKAVNVAVPNSARPPPSYNYYRHHHYRRSIRRISGAANHQSSALSRGKFAAENKVTDIEHAQNSQRSHSRTSFPSRSHSARHSQ